jgi:hypothetical protein
MKRRLFSILFLVTSASILLAQDSQKPNPVPSDILGPQLIAWSQLQQPQPVQEQQPPTQTGRQTEQPQAVSPTQPDQSPSTQTLTGTIVKDSGHYILQVSGTSTAYELDDQDRARQYEGKQVKIAGKLDAKGNSFHIINIELIS